MNTHSYQTLSNDIRLLKLLLTKYLAFKSEMQWLQTVVINKINVNKYLEIIGKNTKELNEDYLLLVAY